MTVRQPETDGPVKRLAGDGIAALMDILRAAGREVIGPTVRDGAVVLAPLSGPDDLPRGWRDSQDAARYRLSRDSGPARFAHAVPAQGWKRFVHPPEARLWTARPDPQNGLTIDPPDPPPPPRAFLGVRPCDVAALGVLDGVFANPDADHHDPAYALRRRDALVIAVDCGTPAASCFCASMDTGPAATGGGYDLALTELVGDGGAVYLARAGSPAGAALLEALDGAPASDADRAAARAQADAAAAVQSRAMPAGAAETLAGATDHPHWADVAARCLSCANCTMACPTCFCATVEDATSLDGATATRTRRWSSCFTEAFSYIHGGAVRGERAARYRQWITHKLSAWHDQFGTSGCVGCGRCITWCPVGIDITAEVAALSVGRPVRNRRAPARLRPAADDAPRRRKNDPPA
jgi:Fe-S-cluster-containing hydrogenase component 2